MQIFNFDLSTKNITQVLNVKQGDVGRKFKAVITDRGAAYVIPVGARFSVWFSGPSGEGNYSAIGERTAFAVDGNTVTVELIAQMLENAGTGVLCLVLSDTAGTQLGLWNMIYAVEHIPGMGSKAAEEYYTAMSELAKQAIEAAATFETDPSLSVGGKAADAAAVGTQLAAKAPAGYGLGTHLAAIVENVNSATRSGWYLVEPGATNSPNSTYYAVVRTDSVDGNSVVQSAYVQDGVFSALIRRKTYGTWQPWEWVNPPMQLGVEYRTTERHNGKPVYAKKVSYTPSETIGSTSGVATILIPHGISGFGGLVRENCTIANVIPLPLMAESGEVSTAVITVASTNIELRINKRTWNSGNIFVFDLYYTK